MRKKEHDVNETFINRWSPRAMSGENIADEELLTLFEAARWAPSCFNEQPWRFIYAKRDTDSWNKLFNLLSEGNKVWTKNASVLAVVISSKVFKHNNKPNVTHSYDTGAAWENLALQGSLKGLVVHGMGGFDYVKARELLGLSDEYNVEAMLAIGKPGKKEDLPEQLQEREFPSDRRQISESFFELSRWK